MKIYGYTLSASDSLEEFREVSFVATAEELSALADFFLKKAAAFEQDSSLDHFHFSDFLGDKEMDREVVLCNPAVFPV